MSTEIYCGNNSKNQKLISKKAILGTNYTCFKKGIGAGLQMESYSGDYKPIDSRKIWCGKNKKLPDGYDIMGNLPLCLQKGIGVGRSKARHGSTQGNAPLYYKKNIVGPLYLNYQKKCLIVFVLIIVIVLILIYIFIHNCYQISTKEEEF